MNEHDIESVRRHIGSALIHLFRARGCHSRDEDLTRAAEALEKASSVLRIPADESPGERA
jgi:hypothetical protein